jgi:hypothetical protein
MAAPPKIAEVTEASLSRWSRALGDSGEDQREALKELAASEPVIGGDDGGVRCVLVIVGNWHGRLSTSIAQGVRRCSFA